MGGEENLADVSELDVEEEASEDGDVEDAESEEEEE